MIKITSIETFSSLPQLTIELGNFSVITGINGSGKSQFLELIEDQKTNIEKFDSNLGNWLNFKPSIKRIEFDRYKPIAPSNTNLLNIMQEVQNIRNQHNNSHIEFKKLLTKHYAKPLDKLTDDEITQYIHLANNVENITHIDFSKLFFNYKYNLDENNKLKGEKSQKALSKKKFIAKYGEAPWELVNSYLSTLGLNYYVTQPKIESKITASVKCEFKNKETNELIEINKLSSGEQLFLTFIGMLLNFMQDLRKPIDILLLDEPDATLHPHMIKKFINFLKTESSLKKIYIVMTTHSPTTVALCDNDEIYEINNKTTSNTISSISKEEALKNLLDGVPSLQLLTTNTKQVFVESDKDVNYYSKIFEYLKLNDKDIIPNGLQLNFISSGTKESSTGGGDTGCSSKVEILVSNLRAAGNSTIYGITDWDLTRKSNDNIYVIGENNRYSKENYIYDPIILASILINHCPTSKYATDHLSQFIGNSYEKIKHMSDRELEKLADAFINGLNLQLNADKITIRYKSGKNIRINKDYLYFQGHNLESQILENIPEINQFSAGHKNNLEDAIIERMFKINMSEFISQDIIDVFNKIIYS